MRPIDADAAADKIMHEVEVHADEIGIGAVAIMIAFARALRDETDFPTIEPEVPHGRWIEENPKDSKHCSLVRCSECGFTVCLSMNVPLADWAEDRCYCQKCGARMDGGAYK